MSYCARAHLTAIDITVRMNVAAMMSVSANLCVRIDIVLRVGVELRRTECLQVHFHAI